jgi:hypothetical protein
LGDHEEKEITAVEYLLQGKGFYCLEDKKHSKEEAMAHDSKVPEAPEAYEALKQKLLASL